MAIGLLGRKVGMTQIFDEAGNVVPVTVIQAGPCQVLQLRSKDRDGYEGVQLGFGDKPRRLASRSERGHVAKLDSKQSKRKAKAGVAVVPKSDGEPQCFIREFRVPIDGLSVGQKLDVTQFLKTAIDSKTKKEVAVVVRVDVTGTSKGRGTAGVMVRHNFKGQRATHGVKKVHRHMGGTGALAANRGGGRMKKGKKMPGQYGHERVTVRNIKLVKIYKDNNLLLIDGCVPGPNGSYVIIRETNKVG